MSSGPGGRILSFAAFVLALSLLVALSACGDEENGSGNGDPHTLGHV